MEFSGQYLTYDEYRLMGGTLEIMPFNLLEYNARKVLNKRTQYRLLKREISEDVKICIYAMINSIYSYSNETNITNRNIASENTDGYSVSYITTAQIQDAIKSKKSELEDIMFNHLDIDLLYLGVK